MTQEEFEWMLEMVAKQQGCSREQIRAEMQSAMEEGMRNPDPAVQKRWQQIPRKGEQLTLEEFCDYLLSYV